jgi:hypothetical protein
MILAVSMCDELGFDALDATIFHLINVCITI